jgi:hypothetical protein
MPARRKGIDQLRRTNRPEQWVELPAGGCTLPAPSWPLPQKPTAPELAHWKRLWRLPVAAWWHDQAVDPALPANYVRLFSVNDADPKPSGYAVLIRMEQALAMSPEGLSKMRLVVVSPKPEPKPEADPYAELRRNYKGVSK